MQSSRNFFGDGDGQAQVAFGSVAKDERKVLIAWIKTYAKYKKLGFKQAYDDELEVELHDLRKSIESHGARKTFKMRWGHLKDLRTRAHHQNPSATVENMNTLMQVASDFEKVQMHRYDKDLDNKFLISIRNQFINNRFLSYNQVVAFIRMCGQKPKIKIHERAFRSIIGTSALVDSVDEYIQQQVVTRRHPT